MTRELNKYVLFIRFRWAQIMRERHDKVTRQEFKQYSKQVAAEYQFLKLTGKLDDALTGHIVVKTEPIQEMKANYTQTSYSIYAMNNSHKGLQAVLPRYDAANQTNKSGVSKSTNTKATVISDKTAAGLKKEQTSYLYTYQLTPDNSRESIQGGVADDELSDSSEEILIQYNSKPPDYNVDERYFKFMTMATKMAFENMQEAYILGLSQSKALAKTKNLQEVAHRASSVEEDWSEIDPTDATNKSPSVTAPTTTPAFARVTTTTISSPSNNQKLLSTHKMSANATPKTCSPFTSFESIQKSITETDEKMNKNKITTGTMVAMAATTVAAAAGTTAVLSGGTEVGTAGAATATNAALMSNAVPQSTLAHNANQAQLVEQAMEPQSLANQISPQEPMKINHNELFNKGVDGLNEHTNLVQVSSHVMRSMMSTNHSNSLMSGGDFLLDENDSKLINTLITESSKLSEQILDSLNNDDEEERLLAERYGTDESVTKTISAVISKSISDHYPLSDLTVQTKDTFSLGDISQDENFDEKVLSLDDISQVKDSDEKVLSLDDISLSDDLPSVKENEIDNEDITISDIQLDEDITISDIQLDEDDPLIEDTQLDEDNPLSEDPLDFSMSDMQDDNFSDLDFDMEEEFDGVEIDDESVLPDDESDTEWFDIEPSNEQTKKPSVLGKIRESIRTVLKRESNEAKLNEEPRNSFLFRAQKKSCSIQ